MPTPSDPCAMLAGLYDALNRHDLDTFVEGFAEDFVDHGDDPPTIGRAAGRAHLAVFLSAFPDLQTSLDQVIVSADRQTLASRTTTTGTHTGDLMGVRPTNRQISVPAVDMCRMSSDGLIAERWGGLDTYALLKQLGVLGAPTAQPAASGAA